MMTVYPNVDFQNGRKAAFKEILVELEKEREKSGARAAAESSKALAWRAGGIEAAIEIVKEIAPKSADAS